jgi:hypothetical protein
VPDPKLNGHLHAAEGLQVIPVAIVHSLVPKLPDMMENVEDLLRRSLLQLEFPKEVSLRRSRQDFQASAGGVSLGQSFTELAQLYDRCARVIVEEGFREPSEVQQLRVDALQEVEVACAYVHQEGARELNQPFETLSLPGYRSATESDPAIATIGLSMPGPLSIDSTQKTEVEVLLKFETFWEDLSGHPNTEYRSRGHRYINTEQIIEIYDSKSGQPVKEGFCILNLASTGAGSIGFAILKGTADEVVALISKAKDGR